VRSQPGGDGVLLEVSGRINLANVRSYAETGADLISVGALTHSAPAADISFKISPM
jgi:nicotinate-nucleotide pyrophosphorylase (carboxylating)